MINDKHQNDRHPSKPPKVAHINKKHSVMIIHSHIINKFQSIYGWSANDVKDKGDGSMVNYRSTTYTLPLMM